LRSGSGIGLQNNLRDCSQNRDNGEALKRPEKLRLDQLLVEHGFYGSREKAQRALMAGLVEVGGRIADKPGLRVAPDVSIAIRGGEKFVGRGGYKLEAALEHFQVDVAGRVAVDIGASTGGFTDCLLQRGAARVHALDVGHGQLHWKIRSNPRVVVREGLNCRHLALADIGEHVSIGVADVSFISLTLILPRVFELLDPEGFMIALIKPQFELSRDRVGKGGIVSDPASHLEAVEKIHAFALNQKWHWIGCIPSPITGTDGNVEFLAVMQP